ncbi:hypothetical protein BDF22DRAFT_669890 [Syncephalis plumigaleata]|nr:hypothetical protein BDF22DRAFT_669890 [Syncephalis plumigaleata]
MSTEVEVMPSAKNEVEDRRAKSTLFVRGLPADVEDEEFESFFSEVGPVRSSFVVREKASNENHDKRKLPCKGFGFVQFAMSEDAERALDELANVKFRNQTLFMELALKRQGTDGSTEQLKNVTLDKQSQEAKEKAIALRKEDPVLRRTVIIMGIPKQVHRKQVVLRARKSGIVDSVEYPWQDDLHIPTDDTAIARVIYKDIDEATKAITQLDGREFKEGKLTVIPASKRLDNMVNDKRARLIVRNIPFKYRENDLRSMFSKFGTVTDVKLPRKDNKPSGLLRGFAFVQFAKLADAAQAIKALNGTSLLNRTIAIDWALAKDQYDQAMLNAMDTETSTAMDTTEDGDDNEQEEEEEASDLEMVDGEGDEEYPDLSSSEEEDDDNEEEEETSEETKENMSDTPKTNIIPMEPGCTLFLRNVSFDTEESSLYELFRSYGKLRYCRITMDHDTGRPRGTAFVCFWKREDADRCIAEASKIDYNKDMLNTDNNNRRTTVKSVLSPEIANSAAQAFTLDGRVLNITRAVDRDQAAKFTEEGIKTRADKRNMYLLQEGLITEGSPAAVGVPPIELKKRAESHALRKNQLNSRPDLFISKTRLSVRNLPLDMDDKGLRRLAISAIGRFKQECKDNKRTPLTAEEREEGWSRMPRVVQAKVVRSKERTDTTTGLARSTGFSFIEYSDHAHALAALRFLNNNPHAIAGHKRRLMVEFSIENAQILKRREERRQRVMHHVSNRSIK